MPQERTLRAISEALTVNGICLIPENGGGVGVRVGTAAPRLLFRRDAVDGHAWVAFAFDYRGARRVGFITYQALDAIDLDRGRLPLEEFDQHQEAILLLAAQLFDRNVIDARGRVLIERGNVNRPPFPENDDGAE